jgi:Domain of unknown function (DUF4209)
LERALRVLGAEVGAATLRASRRGGLEWASLDHMLADPTLSKALGDRLAVAPRRLFSEADGPNYRNEVAHGAADPRHDLGGAALLTTFAILSVCLHVLAARSEQASREPEPDVRPRSEHGGDS